MRGVQELAAADVERLVVDVAGRVAEEEDVARAQVGAVDVLADVDLRVGDPGQVDADLLVRVLDDPGAVEAGRGIRAAPVVGRALVAERVLERPERDRRAGRVDAVDRHRLQARAHRHRRSG